MTLDVTSVVVGAAVAALICTLAAVALCSGAIKEISVERDGARYLVKTYAEVLRGPVP